MWDTIIGLEVHAQLKTRSKLFSSASTQFGAPPNTQANFIDAGFPGVLPVLNQRAVEMAVQFGLAIDADINNLSFFERKNYFYPDLPKGYQISQYQRPIISNGHLVVMLPNQQTKSVVIERAHLEEDAGKSFHTHPLYTGIDLNRAGMPLLEIVTTPCLFSASEAIAYLKTLHQLLRFLELCDGNMQEGSFRCDVNISVKPHNSDTLGTRVELKNLNSFRFIEKAITYEQCRQQDLLESGHHVIQQTRLYDADTNTTQPLRDKEDENDYRYFPDPDLLPITITRPLIKQLKARLPLLPNELRQELKQDKTLSEDDLDFLLTSPKTIQFFNLIKQQCHATQKTIVNWLKGTYTALLKEEGLSFEAPPIPPETVACLLNKLTDNQISTTQARRIFAQLRTATTDLDELIASEINQEQNPSFIEPIILKIIKAHPQQTMDFCSGKEKLLSFFVGQVMKELNGRADPSEVSTLIRTLILDKK
jgi:aspartyl-tRNA(Asn)/glutamyl-tRNA(Gln) amidotransferase subunit B